MTEDREMREALAPLLKQYKEFTRMENDYGQLASGYADGFEAGWKAACESVLAKMRAAFGDVIAAAERGQQHLDLDAFNARTMAE